jgi:nucleotide-binding universal stress UspA family protein
VWLHHFVDAYLQDDIPVPARNLLPMEKYALPRSTEEIAGAMAQILEKEGLETQLRSQTYEAKGVAPASVVRRHPRRVRGQDVSMGSRGSDFSRKARGRAQSAQSQGAMVNDL